MVLRTWVEPVVLGHHLLEVDDGGHNTLPGSSLQKVVKAGNKEYPHWPLFMVVVHPPSQVKITYLPARDSEPVTVDGIGRTDNALVYWVVEGMQLRVKYL